jgi:LacI family transcriptional regulator
MPKVLHVALLIETSRAYGRGLLQGINGYLRAHGPWSIYVQADGLGMPPPKWLREWNGDGILARIDDRLMAETIRETGLPAVDLRYSVRNFGFPHVGLDNRAVVQLAFEHLANCGFKQFGFCGLPPGNNFWMDLRRDLFEQVVLASGSPCYTFDWPSRPKSASWEDEQEQIAAWVRQLPKPIGVMTCNDERGLQLLDACRRINVLVPEEVAVIGVDNDEIICNLSNPNLSSVDVNTYNVGYEAAALLHRMIAGEPRTEQSILLAPGVVVTRESTDVLATEDRELADAIRLIRKHACGGLRLKDFGRMTKLRRRALEQRVRSLLGRSPKEEITRIQLETAKRLLVDTDLPVVAVAEKCGFSQPKYFTQVFHTKVGTPPVLYRRNAKRLFRFNPKWSEPESELCYKPSGNHSLRKRRKNYTAREKVAILRRHLMDGVPVSDLCDEYQLSPTLFYTWEKMFFDNGAAAFEHKSATGDAEYLRVISSLQAKLERKKNLAAELTEERVQRNRSLGEL